MMGRGGESRERKVTRVSDIKGEAALRWSADVSGPAML